NLLYYLFFLYFVLIYHLSISGIIWSINIRSYFLLVTLLIASYPLLAVSICISYCDINPHATFKFTALSSTISILASGAMKDAYFSLQSFAYNSDMFLSFNIAAIGSEYNGFCIAVTFSII